MVKHSIDEILIIRFTALKEGETKVEINDEKYDKLAITTMKLKNPIKITHYL